MRLEHQFSDFCAPDRRDDNRQIEWGLAQLHALRGKKRGFRIEALRRCRLLAEKTLCLLGWVRVRPTIVPAIKERKDRSGWARYSGFWKVTAGESPKRHPIALPPDRFHCS